MINENIENNYSYYISPVFFIFPLIEVWL